MGLLEQIRSPLGASGISLVGNQVWRSDEYNIDLATPQLAIATFDMMRKSDAKVRQSINNLLYSLLSAQWRIDAAKEDKKGGEKIAQFVRSVLMPGETYGYSGTTSWNETLRNVLLSPVFGFSILEKIWAFRPSDAKMVYAALEPRLPKSIRNWTVAKTGISRLESVTQFTQKRDGTFDDIELPARMTPKCGGLIVHVFGQEGDNYWGESLLRPAHFNWRRKRELLKFDAIQKERMGGIFWLTAKAGENPTPEQIKAGKLVLENFRVHEKLGLYFPSCFEFHAEFPNGQGSDFIPSVEYDDRMIEGSMFSQWQSMGTGEKGALSVGQVQMEAMLLAYQAVAKGIEDVFDSPQCIQELVDLNFGPQEFYPRLACENFLQMTPDRLAIVMGPLIAAGAIRIDTPLRKYFREKFSLPPEDEATLEPIPGQAVAGGGAGISTPGSPPSGAVPERKPPEGKPPERGPQPKQAVRKAGLAAMPMLSRDLLAHETGVDWAAMQRYLDEQPNRIWYRDVLPVRDLQIEALSTLAAQASEAQLVSGSIAKPALKELADAIYGGVLDAYKTGRRMVLDEALVARGLTKTVRGLAKAVRTFEEQYPPDPTAKQSTWIKRLAQGLALTMTLGLVKEAVRAGQEAQDQSLDEGARRSAVRDALKALSVPAAQAELGGKVTQAFTTGRVEQGQAMAPEITAVYYSAIMDIGTCDPCAAMDGAELDPEDWASQVPNPNCDWPPNCRCGPVFVWSEQKVAA